MKSREHYSPVFRAEAVRLVLEQGLSQTEAARRWRMEKNRTRLGCMTDC
ncbi:transposase [Aeromonas caviae]|nr:transposase [Aeromonas caviae]